MIVAYVKPTNYCNVGCEHCYLTEDVRADNSKMTQETLLHTAKALKDMSERRGLPVNVIWHGGEPLVMKPEWFEQAGEILDNHLGKHSETIQTSLIPWREEFVDIVHKRWNGHIGSSVDFGTRKIKGSTEAYMDLWMKKVENARKHGIRVVPGCVPSRSDIHNADAIVSWMQDRGFKKFNIERFNSFGQSIPERPSNREHSIFLTGLFDSLMNRMERDGKAPLVRVIVAAIGGVLHSTPGDRWGGSCQSDFIVIEPDGSTNNCPDKTSFEKSYSSIHDGADAFLHSAQRRKWIRVQEISHRKNHCLSCENNIWCRSGCPITPNGKCEGEDECSGFISFLSHVRNFTRTESGHALAEQYRMSAF